MIRGILVCFTIVSSFFLLGNHNALGAEAPAHNPAGVAVFESLKETDKSKVLQIISPQTLQLETGTLVDLSGLHFPDYTPDSVGLYSFMGMEILKDLLLNQTVRIYQTPDKSQGRVNRLGHQLAHVVREKDGVWVQGLLLETGVAQVRTTAQTPQIQAPMLVLEDKARKDKLGLWQKDFHILSPEDAAGYTGTFQIVEGRVQSAALKKNRVYLNFGHNWQSDFTVTIAPEHKPLFSRAGINPLEWNGKILRMRGWITDFNGPNMEIDHPEAIDTTGLNPLSSTPDSQATPQKTILRPLTPTGNALPPPLQIPEKLSLPNPASPDKTAR